MTLTINAEVNNFLRTHANQNKAALRVALRATLAVVDHGNWAPLAKLYTGVESSGLKAAIGAVVVAVYPDAKWKADKGQPSGVRLDRGEAPVSMPNIAMLQTFVDTNESIFGKKFREAFMPKPQKPAEEPEGGEGQGQETTAKTDWKAVFAAYSALTPAAQVEFKAALAKMDKRVQSDLARTLKTAA